MCRTIRRLTLQGLLLLFLPAADNTSASAQSVKVQSHPPIRPMPPVSKRPMEKGAGYFVDVVSGDDDNAGSKTQPWKTINYALKQIKAGDTLYLREGTYFENVYCAVEGSKAKPITIRAFPGERVIIDGGIPEFQKEPAKAWQPSAKGVDGEYVSVKTYRNRRDVLGLFADSHIGLQTYWHRKDLQSDNELWEPDAKTGVVKPVYCGPGLWYNRESGRIHCRLAHTRIKNAKVANYRGETDPRKLPLVVAPFKSTPLFVDRAKHVRFQDLVIRGGGFNTVVLQFGIHIEFDNVTVYCATYGLRARSTGPLRFANSALYGMIPPWGFRTENSLYTYTPRFFDPFLKEPKSTGRNVARLPTHSVLVTEGSYEFEVFHYPYNHDWEVVNSEFTDGHDGVYLAGRNMRFHHNLVENFQDDAIYLSSPVPYYSDKIFIYQNLIRKSLIAFGCHSRGGPDGNIYIFRNIADLREGVNASRPTPTNPKGKLASYHIFLVHGRELLGIESLYFYQNTLVSNAFAGGYAHRTLVNTSSRTKRRVFNNIFVYLNQYGSLPPVPKKTPHDIQCDGNLHWCSNPKAIVPKNYLQRARQSPGAKANGKSYPAGWAARSVLGDPQFLKFTSKETVRNDYRLKKTSPALGKGLVLPKDLEDPIRPRAGARPDIGALPLGHKPFRVGRNGRISVP